MMKASKLIDGLGLFKNLQVNDYWLNGQMYS